ncbi:MULTISPECIES: AAA family ATPase [Bradyrhizobium]|uniref:AAA family ATPase n=1 Tax=Bradyrhizobium TaxID=374 RepID=UPI0004B79A89|nr:MULTISPECIES: AAA family ATPase [Bradyrhizobium]MDI2077389.1 adenylate/guanylate cyclase domain-containing protein [Bradyrhizobium sp. Mp27]
MLTCPACAVTVQPGQRFCSNCGVPLSSEKPPIRTAVDPDAAQHRQLTLIFADIVGSSSLTSSLGPEVFRELLRSFREIAARIVNQYQGHLDRFEGDGIMIHFGFPVAREDDALRAIQACLDLQEAIGVLNERYALPSSAGLLQIRAAVHTGLVIAGDIRSETAMEQMGIVGEAANVAARLQNLANPGSTIISQETYDLVGASFDCRYVGSKLVKGIDRPINIFEVHAAEMGEELRRGPTRSRMIGREREISLLAQLWERALAGEGTLAAIIGEAGVGKSRLLRELFAALKEQKFLSIVLKCSPLYQQSALHPFVKFLTDTLGLSGTPQSERFDRLTRALQLRFADPTDHIAILSKVLSIPPPEGHVVARDYTPQQQKAMFGELLTAWLLRETESQPVLLVVEDLHWADPSTIELLSTILPKATKARACSLTTFRDDCDRSWIEPLQPLNIHLPRLNRQQTFDLIAEIAYDRLLSHEVLESLNARADGVPLFIEELTRLVIEDVGNHGGVPIKLPATLQQSLNARIDRVDANREILNLCATIGREFEHETIVRIWDGDPELLLSELQKLGNAGILEPSGVPPRRKWAFRHALIQEKIYEFALTAHRRDAHAKVAAAIEIRLPAICSDNPEIVAHHLLKARLESKALPFLCRAADKAIERSALQEAAHHLSAALRIIDNLPADAATAAQKMQLLLKAGVVQSSIEGYATPKVGSIFQQARELSRSLNLSTGLFPALHGLYRFYYVRSDMIEASEIAGELLSIAEANPDSSLLVEAHRAVANCAFQVGELTRAMRHFEVSMSYYDRKLHASHRFTFGVDPFVAASSMASINLFLLGETEAALNMEKRSILESENLDHPFSRCMSLNYSLVLLQLTGQTEEVLVQAEKLIELSSQQRFTFWRTGGAIMKGWWLHATETNAALGVKMMTEGIGTWERLGAFAFLAYFTSLLVRAHLKDGDHESASRIVMKAIETAEQKREMWWVPELVRLHCSAIRMRGHIKECQTVETSLCRALELARKQDARHLEASLLEALEHDSVPPNAKMSRSLGENSGRYSARH